MKIEDYYIASADGRRDIINEVNRFIKKGYVPQGGVSMAVDDEGFYFNQAMVKYEKTT